MAGFGFCFTKLGFRLAGFGFCLAGFGSGLVDEDGSGLDGSCSAFDGPGLGRLSIHSVTFCFPVNVLLMTSGLLFLAVCSLLSSVTLTLELQPQHSEL